MNIDDKKVAVIGLGYVGLPLAVEFAKEFDVVGFDIDRRRIEDLRKGRDRTREVSSEDLAAAKRLHLTFSPDDLRDRQIYIVSVPTPIDRAKRPDLTLLVRASETVGKVLSRGDLVIYESTVFPGCTREVCVPILEKFSGLKLNDGFFVGYSPERANPGDREHRLRTTTKVTSGSTPETAAMVSALYGRIVTAGTHQAPSIEVAEAAKVIENTQRDLNIALMNELALIFNRMNIDTHDVLEAAGTKWNFLRFTPGLVGGHCIGVDPYYLTHKAQENDYHPEVILAGRRINDSMGQYVADQVARLMMRKKLPVVGSRILVMGLAFKENTPDIRNSKSVDIVRGLAAYSAEVEVWDPWVEAEDCQSEYDIDPRRELPSAPTYDAVVVAVPHREIREMGPAAIRNLIRPGGVLYDVKSVFEADLTEGRL